MKIDFQSIKLDGSDFNSEIQELKDYAVKKDGEMFFGHFRKQWFGFVFQKNDGKFMQLSFLDEVYLCEDLEKKEKCSRQLSILRNLNKILFKDPSLIGLSFDGNSVNTDELIGLWNQSDIKHNIYYSDLEMLTRSGKRLRFSLNGNQIVLK